MNDATIIVISGFYDPVFTELLHSLRSPDRRFRRASNPFEALNFTSSDPGVGLVISDYFGSPMNGLALVRQLKRRRSNASVVIMSTNELDPHIQKQIEAEGGYFADFPFNEDQMREWAKLIIGAFRTPTHQLQH